MRDAWAAPVASLTAVLCVATMLASSAPSTTPLTTALALALWSAAAVRFSVLLATHRTVVRHLRARAEATVIDGLRVWLTPAAPGAVVAGIVRPQIYVHPTLPSRLDAQPLAAVLRHEREHQRRHDPARLLVLATIEPALRVLPGGHRAVTEMRARWEVRADRSALEAGSTRPALAQALLAISPPTLQGAAAFGAEGDVRLEALLNDGPPSEFRRGQLILTVLLTWLTTCAALWGVQGATGLMASCPLGC